MNLSMMIRVAQHRKWFRKRPRRSWLPCLQSVIVMEIEVPIEPCRYGLLCDQINDLWTKDWFWTMINQLHTKKFWWVLTPLKWLRAIKSKIVSKIKLGAWYIPFESKWIYKINRLGYNILEEARLVKRLFMTKFKELTAIRLDLQQRCL